MISNTFKIYLNRVLFWHLNGKTCSPRMFQFEVWLNGSKVIKSNIKVKVSKSQVVLFCQCF